MLSIGFSPWVSAIGNTFSVEAKAVFSAFTTPPTTARKALIDACITSLKGAGLWAKLDIVVLAAAADSQAGRVNMVTPSQVFGIVGAPVFTVDRGWAAAAVTDSVEPGPAHSAMPKYTQNSAHVGAWFLTNVQGASSVGAYAAADLNYIVARDPTDFASARINTAGGLISVANTDSRGHYVGNRSAAGAIQLYKNGASIGTDTDASTAVDGTAITYFSGYVVGLRCAIAHWGSSLNAGEQAALTAIFTTYLQGVGAA